MPPKSACIRRPSRPSSAIGSLAPCGLCETRRSRSEGTAIAYTAPSCRPSTISNLFSPSPSTAARTPGLLASTGIRCSRGASISTEPSPTSSRGVRAFRASGANTGHNRAQPNLRRKHKALSRKRKGSRNRAKARLVVAAAHERVANARDDFQHRLSKRLVDENQAIITETRAVKTWTSLPAEACVSRPRRSLRPMKQEAERREPLEAPGFIRGEQSHFGGLRPSPGGPYRARVSTFRAEYLPPSGIWRGPLCMLWNISAARWRGRE